jgi:hypothetical protein
MRQRRVGLRRPAPLIARRNRKPTHLRSYPRSAEHARRLPLAVPLKQHVPANRRIDFHLKHPRPPLRISKGTASRVAGFYAAAYSSEQSAGCRHGIQQTKSAPGPPRFFTVNGQFGRKLAAGTRPDTQSLLKVRPIAQPRIWVIPPLSSADPEGSWTPRLPTFQQSHTP